TRGRKCAASNRYSLFSSTFILRRQIQPCPPATCTNAGGPTPTAEIGGQKKEGEADFTFQQQGKEHEGVAIDAWRSPGRGNEVGVRGAAVSTGDEQSRYH